MAAMRLFSQDREATTQTAIHCCSLYAIEQREMMHVRRPAEAGGGSAPVAPAKLP